MRRMVIFLAAVALAAPAMAAPVIWDNYPSGYGPDLLTSMSDPDSAAGNIDALMADDFMFAGPGEPWVITAVEWVGRFSTDAPEPTEDLTFNISFWADDGTGLAPQTPVPDAALGIFPVTPTRTENGDGSYTYSADVSAFGLVAITDFHFWLGIQAVSDFPPRWGLANSLDQQLSPARQHFTLFGLPGWGDPLDLAPITVGADMAYRLRGYQVPEPASLSLLALGVIAVVRRR